MSSDSQTAAAAEAEAKVPDLPSAARVQELAAYDRQVALLPHADDIDIALRTEHVRMITHKTLEFYAAGQTQCHGVFPNADDRKAIRDVLDSKGYTTSEKEATPDVIFWKIPPRKNQAVKRPKKKKVKKPVAPVPAPPPPQDEVIASHS